MSLSQEEERETTRIAELEVRRYFDHYLIEIFPRQVKMMVGQHNDDRKAHGGAERKINKLLWGFGAVVAIMGFAVTVKELWGR